MALNDIYIYIYGCIWLHGSLRLILCVYIYIWFISGRGLSLTPLKNMSSSMGTMTFPIERKQQNIPNHHPADKYSVSF